MVEILGVAPRPSEAHEVKRRRTKKMPPPRPKALVEAKRRCFVVVGSEPSIASGRFGTDTSGPARAQYMWRDLGSRENSSTKKNADESHPITL
jgi:hypothetical protein